MFPETESIFVSQFQFYTVFTQSKMPFKCTATTPVIYVLDKREETFAPSFAEFIPMSLNLRRN